MKNFGAVAFVLGAGLVSGANAAVTVTQTEYNLLNEGNTVTINGAIYSVPTASRDIVGTGYWDPFVRIQMNGTEQGYNTSDRLPGNKTQFDEKVDPNFTTDVTDINYNQIPLVNINGTGYREFLLDINQNNSAAGGALLALDRLQIFFGPDQATNTTAGDYDGHLTLDPSNDKLGNLSAIYSLDTRTGSNGNGTIFDNFLVLNYDNYQGSGKGYDMVLLVPDANFKATGLTSGNVYLYSRFGTDVGQAQYASNDGFEEWALRCPQGGCDGGDGGGGGGGVPEPGSIALLGAALLGIGAIRRKRVI